MRANANKCRQTSTNANKCRGENTNRRKRTRANMDKRTQTLALPFFCDFLHLPFQCRAPKRMAKYRTPTRITNIQCAASGGRQKGIDHFLLFRSPFGNHFCHIFDVFGHVFCLSPFASFLLGQGEYLFT